MASQKKILSTNEIYHLFNRSIGKVDIFSKKEYLFKIKEIVNYYRYPQTLKLSKFNLLSDSEQKEYLDTLANKQPLVDIYINSFMSNHFHFLAKQVQDNGITKFLSKVQDSYAKCFNLKNDRVGGLFQRSFKAKHITNNEEFIHVSRYIHLNHVTSGLIEFNQLLNYEWSSLPVYLDNKINSFINTTPILNYFKTPEKYIKFLEKQVNYQRKLKKIKDLFID